MSVAEDVVNGLQCSHCGVCFEEESGFPVLCEDCYWKQKKSMYDGSTKMNNYSNLLPKSKFKEL